MVNKASPQHRVILITGAAGFLAKPLAQSLASSGKISLILADVVQPEVPKGPRFIDASSGSSDLGGDEEKVHVFPIKTDLTVIDQVQALFKTTIGIPDIIYAMHGIMSRGSEDNFELGLRVNVDSIRLLLDAAVQFGATRVRPEPIRFIFTSSLAIYGGPLPDVVTPTTATTPEGAYGAGKLASEVIINEYSRRGLVDARILRLPTVVVRPGPPSRATSAFISGIIREPLSGVQAICPIGSSLTDPELELPVWIASPEKTVSNLTYASVLPASSFPPHTRSINLPGFTATVLELLKALEAVGGKKALDLVHFEASDLDKRIVQSWPSKFDITQALQMGFTGDNDGVLLIVQQFKKDLEENKV